MRPRDRTAVYYTTHRRAFAGHRIRWSTIASHVFALPRERIARLPWKLGRQGIRIDRTYAEELAKLCGSGIGLINPAGQPPMALQQPASCRRCIAGRRGETTTGSQGSGARTATHRADQNSNLSTRQLEIWRSSVPKAFAFRVADDNIKQGAKDLVAARPRHLHVRCLAELLLVTGMSMGGAGGRGVS